MRNMQKDRRGVAIEMAIGFMAVAFALCAILVTITYNVRVQDKKLTNTANESFVLDQLGEYFVSSVRDQSKESKNVVEANQLGELLTKHKNHEDMSAEEQETVENLLKWMSEYEIVYYEDTAREYTERDYNWLRNLLGIARNEITSKTVYTMKIWNLEELKQTAAASGKTYVQNAEDESVIERNESICKKVTPLLIVSVQEINVERGGASTSTYRILNWSDQENVIDYQNYNSGGKRMPGLGLLGWLLLLLVGALALTVIAIAIIL